MKITFLGTGTSQGVPIIQCDCEVCSSKDFRDKRLRTSLHISDKELSLVIDCGPDFRQQMLNNGIRSLDAIIYTHEHADHTAGLDDIRPFYFLNDNPIPLFAEQIVLDQIKERFSYIFANRPYPGVPKVILNAIHPLQSFDILGLEISPFRVWHGELGILGYKIKNLVYITDAHHLDDQTIEYIGSPDVLVVNALRHKPHPTHFDLQEALAFIEKVKPRKAYLIHISHALGKHELISKQLPEHVFLAYDGLQLEL